MEDLITRTGGESETQAGKLIPSFVIDTAGAPASARRTGEDAAAAAPEWIELLPAGVFYGRDGRGPFRLDDPAAVIASTIALQMNAGLPIDYDHATDFGAPEGRPAPAAGWIRELEVRGGAVWGRVEWTARAASSIVAREYRYVSPVFQFDPKDGVVTRLLRAGLTNNPNLHLTAIAASLTAAATKRRTNTWNFQAQELRELLNLEGDATVAEVVAKVRELRAAGRCGGVTVDQRACARPGALRGDRGVRAGAHRAQRAQGRAGARARGAYGGRGDSRGQDRAGAARMGDRVLRGGRARIRGVRGQAAVDTRREPGPGGRAAGGPARAAGSTRQSSQSARSSASSIRSLFDASADARTS